ATSGSMTFTAPAPVGSYEFRYLPNNGYTSVAVSNRVQVQADNQGVTLAPAADAYTRDGSYADINYGTSTQLVAKNAGGGNSGYDRVIYLTFNLSVSTIPSAQLRLFGNIGSTNDTNLTAAVYGVTNPNWSETGITWNNAPALGSTALATGTILDNTPR